MPHRAAAAARALAAAALALALAGCDTVSDNAPEIRLEVLEPSRAPEEEPLARVPEAEIVRLPVATVESLELGVTRTGRLLTAYGSAPALGWFQPALIPRNDGRPAPDGFIEYDFLAAPPEIGDEAAPVPGTPAQRRIRADRLISERLAVEAAGIRVFAAYGPPVALRLASPTPEG